MLAKENYRCLILWLCTTKPASIFFPGIAVPANIVCWENHTNCSQLEMFLNSTHHCRTDENQGSHIFLRKRFSSPSIFFFISCPVFFKLSELFFYPVFFAASYFFCFLECWQLLYKSDRWRMISRSGFFNSSTGNIGWSFFTFFNCLSPFLLTLLFPTLLIQEIYRERERDLLLLFFFFTI